MRSRVVSSETASITVLLCMAMGLVRRSHALEEMGASPTIRAHMASSSGTAGTDTSDSFLTRRSTQGGAVFHRVVHNRV